MNILLKSLRNEHQKILKMMDDNVDILEIIHFVEKVHHPKEEQELFPLIAQSPLLCQGGPFCTYFRGVDLDLNPQEEPRRHLASLYKQGCPKPKEYPTFVWLNQQNPLSMPMNEHQLGHDLSEALQFLNLHRDSALYESYYLKLSEDYKNLLKAHIDKEDRCLFVMCERILD